jgi:hypothetical protein
MYEKDKLHMVFYINVNDIADEDVSSYVEQVAKAFRSEDGTVVKYFIPTTSGETRIEVLPTFRAFCPLDDFNKILNEEATPCYQEVKNNIVERLCKVKDDKKLDSNIL